MNKKVLLCIILGAAILAALLYFVFRVLLKPAKEEAVVYENKVAETIDAQLKNLPLDAIRGKSALIMEKSIEDIQSAVSKGELTYTELTAFYLDRIKTYDKVSKGINAIIEINPSAIADAQKLDAEKARTKTPIYGMPILLKDNINTKDMVTSGGTFALKDFRPAENAAVVTALLNQQAILLGKANLSELANYVDTQMPSGYSSKIGQTHNPFDPLILSPLGSSSGSAAAVAVNFSAVSLGTETTGSIIAPAFIHSLVGFKPSKGLISTEGVLPLSSTMDTVGPIAKTVKDAVVLFNASLQDPAKQIKLSFGAKDLAQKRIAVFKGTDSDKLSEALKKAGAEVIELEADSQYEQNEWIIRQDFKPDFEAYARKHNLPVKTLAELVKFNQQDEDRRAKYGQVLLEEAAEDAGSKKDQVTQTVTSAQAYIRKLFTDHKLDAAAFVNDSASAIPCIAGYPEITVPLGKNQQQEPMGATFFGLGGEDTKVVNIAYAFEQSTQQRLIPEKYKDIAGK